MSSRFSQKRNKLTQYLITILLAINVTGGFIFAFENKIQMLYIHTARVTTLINVA